MTLTWSSRSWMGALALMTLAATTKVLRARPSSLPCRQKVAQALMRQNTDGWQQS